MNTPVSFELAKLLKEKGFDTPTFYYYENEKLVEPYLENGSSTDTEFRVDLSDLKEYFNKWSKTVSAPTVVEVVMWLYEKHGIWISVECDCYAELWFSKLSVASEKNWDNIDLRHEIISAAKKFPNEHNSPTEAYEAAIEYTLNNLI